MSYPSLSIIALFIYFLFRPRNCDCGCGQNCQQDCGDNPNTGRIFCENCSDTESCKSESSSKTTSTDEPPPPPPPPPRRFWTPTKIIVAGAATVSTASVSGFLIARAFFVPPMPNFALPGITVNSFDISTPNVIRASFQVRVSSRNSHKLVRFSFDRLRIYVTYRNQQITYSTTLPPNHEGHNKSDAWTANVFGSPVTLDPNNAVALCQEQATGSVKVTITIVGRVRWKFWFFPSTKHKFSVKCSASIDIGSQQTQITVRKCSVNL